MPSIYQELEDTGYIVIDFLSESEVQNLLNFDKKHSLPDDLVKAGMAFSIGTVNVSYRQAITTEIRRFFVPRLATLFPKYRMMLGNFVQNPPHLLHSIMPLHQDPSLVDEASRQSFGVWCPLIDVNEQNGCLQVVKKSHLLNSKLRPLFTFEGFPYSEDILSFMEQHYLTSIPMKAGQAIVYDKRLFHGSPPNLTDTERLAAICSLVPEQILTQFCYRETSASNQVELFEVEDEFYDHYIVGQKPEGVKSLGIFDYEVDTVTPEILVEKLGAGNLSIPAWADYQISFKPKFLEKFNQSAQKIAILVSNEFEGFSRNGGIGTYYTTLTQKLAADGWYVLLLLCQTETEFQGEASFPHLHHVFSTHETAQILELQPLHHQILAKTQQDPITHSFDYQSFCCLFFTQAVVATFPEAVVYIEFPEIWGFGYRTIQAKQAGLLGNSCLTSVTSHGGFEWLREVNSQYAINQPQWFWQAYYYEQFSYENADLAYFPSYFLKAKLTSYGWKTTSAKHLPYLVPIVELLDSDSIIPSPVNPNSKKIPVVFFGRLEERKGLCTFIEAIKLLQTELTEKINLIFIGKIIPLQSSQLQHLNSQQYIEGELGNNVTYNILPNLPSQSAIQFIAELDRAIVCLTSFQENFPHTSLEMGQLPVSLVVAETGGFQETLDLLDRQDGVRYFPPGNAPALALTITQALQAHPETPSIPKHDFLVQVNQRLLNQRLEYMSQAFLDAAPKEPQTPKITIGIAYLHPTKTLIDCLESIAAQTYSNFEVIILYLESDEFVNQIITEAQTKFPNYKYLSSDPNMGLGETYNYLVKLATGEYFLQISAEYIALPKMLENLVIAAGESNADVVTCPQATLAEDGKIKAIAFIDGNLLNLLEFKHDRDVCALFSIKLVQEFRYCQERDLQALNWHIFAAAIATDKQITYYPYPLYAVDSSFKSVIDSANIPKERYYLRQYLFQIEPSKWNQRQLNLLLIGFEQLLQQQQIPLQNNQQLPPQSQAWMIAAQQIQEELTQTQATLRNLQAWNQQLQAGKDWLESQWQTWMLKAQKIEVEWERSRSLVQEMQESKFWKVRKLWIKLKRKLGRISTDPLQFTAYTLTPGVQEFVARIAGQKVRFFHPTATQTPVVSIISSCFGEYQYIETTYRSITNQTLQNFEWLIVDDGSTHLETKTLLASLPQRTAKIRILSNAAHLGVAASYNIAIAQASSKYLCFIDFGAILDPTYLEKCVLFLETHPQISVVNSYSIVFQAQEHWWHSRLNQPTSLFHQNGIMSHPLYRKTDFDQLGGFDESLHKFTEWERCLKAICATQTDAIAHHQIGWTIPEYLDCYRATDDTMPAIAAELQPTVSTIQSRYQSVINKLPSITTLEPQNLKLERLTLANQSDRPNSGKRILLFCEALDNSDIAKGNCELVILLAQQGYEVTIATTSTSAHTCQEFFYQATADIFHLPHLFDKAHWLAFIRYILASRQIDGVLIYSSEIIYTFLPLLRTEFPHLALVDYAPQETFTLFPQLIHLDCQLIAAYPQGTSNLSLNSPAQSQTKVCLTSEEVEFALAEAITARQDLATFQ